MTARCRPARAPMTGARAAGALAIAVLTVGVLVACGAATPDGERAPAADGAPAGAQRAVVAEVVDGDTLRLVGEGDGPLPDGERARVRLLGVDTPEVEGYREQECFGPEASAWTRARLPRGTVLQVVADEEVRDRYGRVLLHVWDEQGHVNVAMVAAGVAEVVQYDPNRAYDEELRAAEDEARRAARGLWGAC